MKPKLYVHKIRKFIGGKTLAYTFFAVVDADNPHGYPRNYLCVMPKTERSFRQDVKPKSQFARVFGEHSVEVAKTLLKDGLSTETDPLVLKEIKDRLNQISLHYRFLTTSKS